MHHWKLFAGPAGPLDYFLKAIGHFLASSGFLLMGIVAFVFSADGNSIHSLYGIAAFNVHF